MESNQIKDSNNKFNLGYFVALILLICSMFFLSPNFTGNVIGSVDVEHSSFISLVLFVFGIATFFIMKNND